MSYNASGCSSSTSSSPFKLSDQQHLMGTSFVASSSQNNGLSDTNTATISEFIPTFVAPAMHQQAVKTTGHNQSSRRCSGGAKKVLPSALTVGLSTEDIDIAKQVEALAFDQAGCRMIQKKIEENGSSKKWVTAFAGALIYCMLDILPEAMTNQFGNYLCQKLIEVSSVETIKQLIHAILPQIVDISMNLHGTRVIQTLVEALGTDPAFLHNEILAIGAQMSQYIFEMSTHANGNHVIQAFLLTFRASDRPEQTDRVGSETFGVYT